MNFILVCAIFGFLAFNTVNGQPPQKYLLSVYYNILCSDSRNFIQRQLTPVFNHFGGLDNPIFEIDFVPYGKANTIDNGNGNYSFTCQFGPAECEGNRMQACALNHYPAQFHADFIACTMGNAESGPDCATQFGLDFSPIQNCIENEGDSLLAQNGIRTHALDPQLHYVPWIIFDGDFTEENLWDSQDDLLTTICLKFGHEHPKCKERKSNTIQWIMMY